MLLEVPPEATPYDKLADAGLPQDETLGSDVVLAGNLEVIVIP